MTYSRAIRLFDPIERSDYTPATNAERSFEFLNRIAGPYWDRLRATLEGWFVDYPRDHAADLRGRFRSERAGSHLAAWWELYLHRLFTCLGYELDVHPKLPDSPAQPDFLLTRGTDRLYLEAAVVFSGIVSNEERHAAREGWILDALNKHYDPNFMLHVEFERVGRLRPRDRDVFRPVAACLADLDPDAVHAEYECVGALPERSFAVGDEWQMRYRAIPEADLRYTARRYFTIDGARLAAIQLADATFAARDPVIWGQSTTTVASDSTHFRAYDQNLFTEWHSRYGGRGVLIYWHVEKKSMVVHSQLISCAASEVAAMVEGAMRHGTSMALEGN